MCTSRHEIYFVRSSTLFDCDCMDLAALCSRDFQFQRHGECVSSADLPLWLIAAVRIK